MSVINKMLRDLDQRQVPDDNGAAKPGATPLRSGTASVPGGLISTRTARGKAVAAPIGVAMAVLAVCGGAAWWWLTQVPAARPQVALSPSAAAVAPMVQATSTPIASMPAASPVASSVLPSAAQSTAPPPLLAASGTAAKPAAMAVGIAPAIVSAPASASAPVPEAVHPTPKPVQPVANAVTNALATQPSQAPAVAAASNAPSVPDTVSTGLRQQQAARDALAQAQALWNSGAHDNAIDLLQQAVATAERSAHSTPGAPATQALTSLARELARMQVAQGRPGASVDMLARLEPLLGGDAEVWAVRANAAQRAGRHQDSVAAYTTALQSRPNEQRWLLGAAVSSAALGQTANAAAFADKAAAVGPIAKDVQAYLRQMGVPLKD